MQLRLAALTAAVAVAFAASAHATPAQDLAAARDAFRVAAYDKAVPLLDLLLYPDAKLASTEDLVEAHVLLAVCQFEVGNQRNAAKEFEEALYLDLELDLDTLLFSEEAVEFFDEIKKRVTEKAAQDARVRELAEKSDRLQKALENLVVIQRRPYWINFLPLGAGQFQNGQTNKGTAFFISEAVLGGTSMGIFVWQWQKFGFGGQVPRDEASLVRRMQQVQIGTGLVALGLMAWGIVDALVNYEPTTQLKADESFLPADFNKALPEDKTDSEGATGKAPSSSLQLHIVPLVSPQAGGLTLSLEF